MKIKLNDKVLITKGRNKGKKGTVIKILKKDDKVVVEKVNIITRHMKKTPQRAGEIVKFEGPISVSNVKLICPHCEKSVKVKYQIVEKGKKERICNKCGGVLDMKLTVKK